MTEKLILLKIHFSYQEYYKILFMFKGDIMSDINSSTKFQNNILIILLLILVIIFSISLLESYNNRYEYSIASIEDFLFDFTIDKIGNEGWELVFARRAINENSKGIYECIFKRKLTLLNYIVSKKK
ncbi:MAG: hypothetical protein GYA62_14385 [Bacteroidales bacterium]|nr:hypothetical protein [Bacteroidales bacterium]